MLKKEELISNFIKNELNDVPNVLSRDLSKNNKKFNARDELNELKGYVDTFLNEDTSNKIVVLPGLRGVDKTTLILQLYEYLMKEKNIPPKNPIAAGIALPSLISNDGINNDQTDAAIITPDAKPSKNLWKCWFNSFFVR